MINWSNPINRFSHTSLDLYFIKENLNKFAQRKQHILLQVLKLRAWGNHQKNKTQRKLSCLLNQFTCRRACVEAGVCACVCVFISSPDTRSSGRPDQQTARTPAAAFPGHIQALVSESVFDCWRRCCRPVGRRTGPGWRPRSEELRLSALSELDSRLCPTASLRHPASKP